MLDAAPAVKGKVYSIFFGGPHALAAMGATPESQNHKNG
jgi:hypothetical protein